MRNPVAWGTVTDHLPCLSVNGREFQDDESCQLLLRLRIGPILHAALSLLKTYGRSRLRYFKSIGALSYRQAAFTRIKERNAQRLQECMRKGKLKVLFNSNPVEVKQDSVVLDVAGKTQVLPNDYVWVFAGGEPPTAFLEKIGVGFGTRDLTTSASKEAKAAKEAMLALR